MRSIDLAFEDIKRAIQSDIVHKYLLRHAPDMIALAKLAKICHEYDLTLFAFVASIAHVMVNPLVIEELSEAIKQNNGNKELIWKYVTHPATKTRWNTFQSHTQMKAVSSDYDKHGGYHLGDINAGVAAKFFDPDFKNRFNELVFMVSEWLYAPGPVKEDELIESIFNLNVPGMHDEKDKEKGYWLLHFCRWISFVRSTVFHLPIVESTRYLDMIGVRLFRSHYDDLTLEEMPELFERCKDFISTFEIDNDRPDTVINYGDFGCLTCETHRMLTQLSAELHTTERDAQSILEGRIAHRESLGKWLEYKKTHTDPSQGPSIVESARYNAGLFARHCEKKRRAREEEVFFRNHPVAYY